MLHFTEYVVYAFVVTGRLLAQSHGESSSLPTPFNPEYARTEMRRTIRTEMLGKSAHCGGNNAFVNHKESCLLLG